MLEHFLRRVFLAFCFGLLQLFIGELSPCPGVEQALMLRLQLLNALVFGRGQDVPERAPSGTSSPD